MHAGRPPSHSAHLVPSARDKLSGTHGRPTAAHQHAAHHLLLSLTRQWLMTERHLTQYYSQRSQIIEDTVEPSLPAREINLKACAPEIRTQNLPIDLGIEPRLPRQTVLVGVHCVSAN